MLFIWGMKLLLGFLAALLVAGYNNCGPNPETVDEAKLVSHSLGETAQAEEE